MAPKDAEPQRAARMAASALEPPSRSLSPHIVEPSRMQRIVFRLPRPSRERPRVHPVFLPFSGCPGRCVYCAQDRQTATAPAPLSWHLERLAAELESVREHGGAPIELGFFGGTFTGLPEPWWKQFLDLAAAYRAHGVVTRIRCSTRPDRIDPQRLRAMRSHGLDMVELGIQSFDGEVLRRSKRGYGEDRARTACRMVRESGMELGIQLLPGLPGHDHRKWRRDVMVARSFRPSGVRIYPCLVLRGTELHALRGEKGFQPWDLAETVQALAFGVFAFWRCGVPVIRLGLPPEGGLLEQVADGPWHPALGNMVRSRVVARFLYVHVAASGIRPERLLVPRSFSGDIWGHQSANRPLLSRLGLTPEKVVFWERTVFVLEGRRTAGLPAVSFRV